MWRDKNGFKHNGPTPYLRRKLDKLRSGMSDEERYKEKVDEVCAWLNNRIVYNHTTKKTEFNTLGYTSKTEILDDLRKMLQFDFKK